MIIEDDPGTRALLQTAAETAGWWVDHGANHREVWAALRHADAVTLDVNLGEEDGLDILRQLRSDGYTTPVFVVSGIDRPGLEAEAVAAGATRFLVKPFDIIELLDLLRDERGVPGQSGRVVVDLACDPAAEPEKAWFMS